MERQDEIYRVTQVGPSTKMTCQGSENNCRPGTPDSNIVDNVVTRQVWFVDTDSQKHSEIFIACDYFNPRAKDGENCSISDGPCCGEVNWEIQSELANLKPLTV